MGDRIIRILVATGCFCFVGLFGCPATTPETHSQLSKPFQGQELELVVPKSFNLPATWDVMIEEWSSQSGATARFVEYDVDQTAPPRKVPAGSSGGSLVLFPLNQLPAMDSQLSRLPATHGEFDSRDIFKGLRERALSRERRLIANPVSVPILACYYRSDLLRAANRKPPETWDDYHELIDKVDSWAPGLVAVEPLSPEFRATTFFARSLAYCKHPENYSVWFDVDSAKPTLNSSGFVRALEVAQRTWQKLPAQTHTYQPADCRRLLLTGKAAIGLSLEPRSADFSIHPANDDAARNVRIDGIELGICRLPGSRSVFNRNSKKWDAIPGKAVNAPALCGFAGLATGVILPANRGDETAALNLLFSLSSSALYDQAFATLPKGPCRESQSSEAPVWFGSELSADEASQYCDAVAQSLRDPQLVFELPLVGADEFRRAAAVGLESLLRGDSDVEKSLDSMQASFEKIVEYHGTETIRDSYRRGLGMSPATKKAVQLE